MQAILEIKNLSVSFNTAQGELEAVRDVSFSLNKGEVFAIVGESGCGKSVLCKTIMKLLPDNGFIKGGSILVNGTDITNYCQKDMECLRRKVFSMVLQDPMTSLDPSVCIGKQIAEAVKICNPKMKHNAIYNRVIELMTLVGITNPEYRYKLYPHNFSGGMLQRTVIAMALASEPKILFADEPTTSLDVTIQSQILNLLKDIQKKFQTAIVFVSHDLGVIARVADRIAVMYAGKIVEMGTSRDIFYNSCHPYTWGLMRSLPYFAKNGEELYTIPGMPPVLINPPIGDAFACRNKYALNIDYEEMPPMFKVSDTHYAATWLLDKRAPKICPDIFPTFVLHSCTVPDTRQDEKNSCNISTNILLDVQHLSQYFKLGKNNVVKAADDLSFQIRRGEIFGLVGESGSGKSTVARCIMNIYKPFSGQILYKGINIYNRKQFFKNRKMLQSSRQMIFQDSASSLDKHMTVVDIIAEPMKICNIKPKRGSFRNEAEFQLYYVGMDKSYLDKYPDELSGGMRQRVAIARALSMEPELLVADEPVASLDVSLQSQIINLFKHLQAEHGFSFLFIAHDLSVVRYLCDRVGVMYKGKLVEVAPVNELFENPLHPYTKALLSSVPIPDPQREMEKTMLEWREND